MNWIKMVLQQKENKMENTRYSTKKTSLIGISLSPEPVNEKKFTHSLQAYHTKYLDMLKNDFTAAYADPQTSRKPITEFDEVRVLGSGSFGTVYLVRDTLNFTYHAMKVIDKQVVMQKKNLKSIYSEKKILQSVNFPFLTSLNYTSKDNLYVYFILPFESGGELFSLLKKLGSLSEPLQIFYAAQIVLALEYLHHCSVIHRDVKPENVMISESGYIKLGDFGFSKIIKKRTWTLCGTPEYLAPELIMSQGYTFSVDWWSMGVLIYEMSAGYPPFCASDPIKLYRKILSGTFKTPVCMTSACKSLVKCLMEVDPLKRFGSLRSGVYDIKSHMWFEEIDWNLILHKRVVPPYRPVYRNPGDSSQYPVAKEIKRRKGLICLFQKEFEAF